MRASVARQIAAPRLDAITPTFRSPPKDRIEIIEIAVEPWRPMMVPRI